jgi:hypothetical protein
MNPISEPIGSDQPTKFYGNPGCAMILSDPIVGMIPLDVSKKYTLDRKSKRNWLRLFIYFLNVSISNSLISYNQLAQGKLAYLNYRGLDNIPEKY